MAPNSSAVEIDPRLLRQLEDEYEALRNDSSGPPVDFSRWIRTRLKEAKASGLIRVAKASGAAPALATATVQSGRSRRTDLPVSPASVPTSFTTPPASPAPAPVSPVPSSHTAAAGSSARQPREYALPPTPEPTTFPDKSTTPGRDAQATTNVSLTPPKSPEFSPSVFKPASATRTARRDRDHVSEIDASMENESYVVDRDEVEPTVPGDVSQPPVSGDVIPGDVAPASLTTAPLRFPELTDDIGYDDDADDATSAWFSKPKEHEAAARFLSPEPVDDGLRGVTWNLPPGALPPASVPSVAAAVKAKDAVMANTLGAVGGQARRMAEATALARRDLAARAGFRSGVSDAEALGMAGFDSKMNGNGKLSVAAKSHAAALLAQAERVGVSQKDRQLETSRRREAALGIKNRELTTALDATTKRASQREKSLREAKASAAVADRELKAALERARLGYAPRLATAARGGARAFRVKGNGMANQSGKEVSHTQSGNMASVYHTQFGNTSSFAPSSLREASLRFIGGETEHESGPGDGLKRARVASTSPFSPPPRAAPKVQRNNRADAFLERMRLREEELVMRQARRAWSARADVGKYGSGNSRKPGWDDSPQVVVKVGASPEENRREERLFQAEKALIAARREAFVDAAHLDDHAVSADQIMGGMGFVKETRDASRSPSSAKKKRVSPGGKKQTLSPGQERQRAADARRAAGLDPKFTRIGYGAAVGVPKQKKRSTTPPSKEPKSNDQALRETATRMLDTPAGRASLRASGFDFDLAKSKSWNKSQLKDPPDVPGTRPITKLFAMSPAALRVTDAGGDPRREIAVMRGILDEVVAHLRVLHMAGGGGHTSESPSLAKADAHSVGGMYVSSVSQSMDAARASTSSTGPYVLASVDRSKALEMLRKVEEREVSMRLKWGLGGGSGGTDREKGTYDTVGVHGDSAVLRAQDCIAEIERDMKHVVTRTSVDVSSLRNFTLETSWLDVDSVARVWEARSQYIQWRAAVDESPVINDGEGEQFDSCEVNEEIAERLLDGLLNDVAAELTGACDDATAAVLRQEFTSSVETKNDTQQETQDDDDLFGVGSYDGGSNLLDDDVF